MNLLISALQFSVCIHVWFVYLLIYYLYELYVLCLICSDIKSIKFVTRKANKFTSKMYPFRLRIHLTGCSKLLRKVTKKALICVIALSRAFKYGFFTTRSLNIKFHIIASFVQLCDWLDLSLNHDVPSSLLIISRYI